MVLCVRMGFVCVLTVGTSTTAFIGGLRLFETRHLLEVLQHFSAA